jgi:CBS-domain-containing membrane protein
MLKGDFGALPIDISRDRQGTFEPQIIAKHQTRWSGFDDKIISLYARGLSVREIQGHLEEMYGAEVSPVMERMRWSGVRRVPLVDSAGVLVGIISLDDILEKLSETLAYISCVGRIQRIEEKVVRV